MKVQIDLHAAPHAIFLELRFLARIDQGHAMGGYSWYHQCTLEDIGMKHVEAGAPRKTDISLRRPFNMSVNKVRDLHYKFRHANGHCEEPCC